MTEHKLQVTAQGCGPGAKVSGPPMVFMCKCGEWGRRVLTREDARVAAREYSIHRQNA